MQKRAIQIVLVILLSCLTGYCQENLFDRLARENPSAADSFNTSAGLVKKALDLRANEQYQPAIAKCTEAIQYYPHNSDAFKVRALCQYDLDLDKTKDNLQAVIEDLNSALKFGCSENNSNVYRVRAMVKNLMGNDADGVAKDAIEARLAGSKDMIDRCKNLANHPDMAKSYDLFCSVKPILFSIVYSGNSFENVKITFSGSQHTIKTYRVLKNDPDKWAVLIVVAGDNKSIWYAGLSAGNDKQNAVMLKLNADEFSGDYLSPTFIQNTQAGPGVPGSPWRFAYINLANNQFLSEKEWAILKDKITMQNHYNIDGPILYINL